MSTTTIVAAIIIGIFVTAAIYQIMKTSVVGSKSKERMRLQKQAANTARWLRVYEFERNFFMSRNKLMRVTAQLSGLSVHTPISLKVTAAKTYTRALIMSVSAALIGVIVFKDIYFTLLFIMFAAVIDEVSINRDIDKDKIKVLNQFNMALSNVMQQYYVTQDIPEAIAQAETPELVKKIFEDIYAILTVEDGFERLQEFNSTVPFIQVQTFANTCYLINEKGGGSNDKTKKQLFLDAIGAISTEVRMEIRKFYKTKIAFQTLSTVAIVPVVVMGPLESYFVRALPVTAMIYKGTYGYIAKTLIMVISLAIFKFINSQKRTGTLSEDDRGYFTLYMLRKAWFSSFIDKIIPKRIKKRVKKQRVIDSSLTAKDLKNLYADKVIFATLFYTVAVLLSIGVIMFSKHRTYNNYNDTGLLAMGNISMEEMEFRKQLDDKYLAKKVPPDAEELFLIIKDFDRKLVGTEIQERVNRILNKHSTYYNTFYKWYYLLICAVAGFIGFMLPEIILHFRTQKAVMDAQEDVLQMQTIIGVLMYTRIDVNDLLYNLANQSVIHKRILMESFLNYPSDPDFVMDKLKSRVTIAEFKRMVDKMKLAVSKVTLAESFSDLKDERAHNLLVRELLQDDSIKKKSNTAKLLTMVPTLLVVLFMVIVPIGIAVVQQFRELQQTINSQ